MKNQRGEVVTAVMAVMMVGMMIGMFLMHGGHQTEDSSKHKQQTGSDNHQMHDDTQERKLEPTEVVGH